MLQNKIYFDFETTCSKPQKTSLFQATFLFINKKNEVFEINELIKIKENLNEFREEEKEVLKELHKINNQEDLNIHNKNSITEKELILKFKELLKEFLKEESFKYVEFYGWNNNTFDNVIFQNKFQEEIEDLEIRMRFIDIKDRFFLIKNTLQIFDKNKFHFFKQDKNIEKEEINSLGTIHKFYFGEKNMNFHNSKSDVLAVKDLQEYFEEIFKNLKIK